MEIVFRLTNSFRNGPTPRSTFTDQMHAGWVTLAVAGATCSRRCRTTSAPEVIAPWGAFGGAALSGRLAISERFDHGQHLAPRRERPALVALERVHGQHEL